MNEAAERITANADYIGIVNALNWLVSIGKISAEDSRKTAARIAEQLGVSILLVYVASSTPYGYALKDMVLTADEEQARMAVKETMRKSILLDILNVLLIIRKELKTDEVENFILNALSGEILDKKSKKQIEALLS